jgi:branched-chain amino acid transport system permease protein
MSSSLDRRGADGLGPAEELDTTTPGDAAGTPGGSAVAKPPWSLFTVTRGSGGHRWLRRIVVAAVILILAAIPFNVESVTNDELSRAMMYGLAALGLNLLVGYTGQISLGHGAFFAIGAYTSAVLVTKWSVPYVLTIPAAAVLCGLIGLAFGLPALRLRGLYLALITLALTVAVIPIIKKMDSITGGVQGIAGAAPQTPGFLGGLATDQYYYLLTLVVALIMVALAANLTRGNLGRVLVSVRDDERAASTLGVNRARVKTGIFTVSAAIAGVGGSLFGITQFFIAPESFDFLLSFTLLGAIVVGGVATVYGGFIGTLFLILLQDHAQDINQGLTGVVYGLALVLAIYVLPGGAAGALRRLSRLVVGVVDRTPPRSDESPAVTPADATRPVASGSGGT